MTRYRKNPKLTTSRGRVLANRKPIRDLTPKDLKDNFVVIGPFGPVAELFGHDRTTHVMYCLQDEADRPEIVKAVQSQDFPMFQQHMSIRMAWSQGGSLGAFWKHKIAKRYLAGAVQFHHEDWKTIEGPKNVLVLTHMAVKPKYRKNKLNTHMVDYIIKNRDEAHDLVVFHEPTKDGWAFMKAYGAEEYMDAVRRLGAK
jgi:ribosomal protein S18 acetylase RimI-like enzyme